MACTERAMSFDNSEREAIRDLRLNSRGIKTHEASQCFRVLPLPQHCCLGCEANRSPDLAHRFQSFVFGFEGSILMCFPEATRL